jgi:hypothetical protein
VRVLHISSLFTTEPIGKKYPPSFGSNGKSIKGI